MIKLENTEVLGWEAAIRGMRNPMNSWNKSDSAIQHGDDYWAITNEADQNISENFIIEQITKGLFYDACYIGPNDHKLMMNLAKTGSVDAKFRRMIVVTVDITAPLYWWKEFDTYKVGTVANSCSTMHKIHSKEFTLEDFSCEHLDSILHKVRIADESLIDISSKDVLNDVVRALNLYRELFLATKDKAYWWQMIQLLPSSYNQCRTVMLNYEVLASQYRQRKDHKLDCWREYCGWIESLPYSEIITLEET